mmetsp:Transcript_15218/g.25384  ORF Transcript_15218/g.25384 Transcript_15218/m.25384 type:complete len:223 (+) Transcript_15218:1872-2540(+)
MELASERRGLLVGFLVAGAFQLREEQDMFAHGEVLKEHVVLGTHAQRAADLLHVRQNAVSVDSRAVVARPREQRGVWRNETGEHADGGGLSGPIVAQQREDLVFVHLEAEVVHRHLLAKGLAEFVDRHRGGSQQRLVGVLDGDRLLLGRLHVRHGTLGIPTHRGGSGTIATCTGCGEPVAGLEDEVPGLGHSHLGGPYLREIPGQEGINEDICNHNPTYGGY